MIGTAQQLVPAPKGTRPLVTRDHDYYCAENVPNKQWRVYLGSYDGDDRDGQSRSILVGLDNGHRKRCMAFRVLERVLAKAQVVLSEVSSLFRTEARNYACTHTFVRDGTRGS